MLAPHAGILDSWLPVVHAIRRIKADSNVTLLVPVHYWIKQLDAENALTRATEALIDQLLLSSPLGQWVEFDTIERASYWHPPVLIRLLARFNLVLKLPFIGRLLAPLFQSLESRLMRRPVYGRKEAHAAFVDGGHILTDINIHHREYMNRIWNLADSAKFYSMSHGAGIRIRLSKDRRHTSKAPVFERIYATATSEVSTYEEKFAISGRKCTCLGLPRLDQDWKAFLESQSLPAAPPIPGKYVLIISRPSNSTYLPREKRIEAIQAFREVLMNRYGYGLVIKLHPKERSDDAYEHELGVSNYGKSWVFSSEHALIVGRHADFAVCFGSGIPVDLLYVDVPSIEWLELQNVEHIENDFYMRLPDGGSISTYQQHGHVYGVSSRKEFERGVALMRHDKQKVLEALQERASKTFGNQRDSSDAIARDLLGLTSENSNPSHRKVL